jgi:S1-C subfamily serine protease
MTVLTDLSTALADAVDAVAPALVRVEARRRYGATGLAWKADGYIVTANHVVERDEDITAVIPDIGEKAARLIGRDRSTDLAVLKIDDQLSSTVQPAETDVRVGNLVLALGAQPGEQPMASFGVVAAIQTPWRSRGGRSIDQLVRSDVTLYPGFSGGPLVDAGGRVAGLSTSALTRGLAATLPWSLVEQVATSLVEQGSVKRGYLGIVTQPVEIPAALRSSTGVEQEIGLLVMSVEPDSPAGSVGLLIGDILVGIDDRVLDGLEALQDVLGPGSSGKQVAVHVIRGGNRTDLTITIGER